MLVAEVRQGLLLGRGWGLLLGEDILPGRCREVLIWLLYRKRGW